MYPGACRGVPCKLQEVSRLAVSTVVKFNNFCLLEEKNEATSSPHRCVALSIGKERVEENNGVLLKTRGVQDYQAEALQSSNCYQEAC